MEVSSITWPELERTKTRLVLLVFFLVLSMTGCAGSSSYLVKRSTDDPFADKSGSSIITLDENHIIRKAPSWSVPFSQLIPYTTRDNAGNNQEMGFHLINVQSDIADPSARWLNIRDGDELVFLVDGNRIAAKASSTRLDHDSEFNAFLKKTTTHYYDFAWYKLTKEQMEKVCNSRNVKIKVYGRDGTDEYGTGKDGFNDLLESFYNNNRKFFTEEISGKPMNSVMR
ncbi:MAG: hypothetical protein ACXVHS_09020 [Methanobacterium sp.]